MTELKPCPCGKVPRELSVVPHPDYDVLIISHCVWAVILWWPQGTPPDEGVADQAWNSAPRAEQ